MRGPHQSAKAWTLADPYSGPMVRRKPKRTIELNQDEVLTFLGGSPRAASRRISI